MIGQNAAFSGHPPLAARLVASRAARCESTARQAGQYRHLRPDKAARKIEVRRRPSVLGPSLRTPTEPPGVRAKPIRLRAPHIDGQISGSN